MMEAMVVLGANRRMAPMPKAAATMPRENCEMILRKSSTSSLMKKMISGDSVR